MEFTNRFHIPLPLEDAWTLMLDVPRILPCLPGARLTGTAGADQYLGSVSVKLGPIKLSFDGRAELLRKDAATHTAWLRGSGLDPKGRGAAQSEFSFALAEAAAGGTDVTVRTDLQLSGAVAQYGRGSGMIEEVAGHILKQFERNLAALVQGGGDAGAAPMPATAAAPAAAASPLSAPAAGGPAPAASTPAEAQAILLQAQAVLAQAQATLAAAQRTMLARQAAPASGELNMLSIGLKALWARAKYTVGGLFGRR
ncbi:subunit of carbon monoxide dehydrogenase [Bordetella ansorpii]|uniref:Subunit of carbon monoxide dehydrogenase n=1 Tax=Bordetella ansorpii TaxID=288768 RepID=A0A157PH70_9BORD|nr:SRPBCC family protein [Bordetella ansorpii]SAI32975.1 subunit of carbon monoxide dehydrogenase [Bordetella ansorpii]